MVRCNVSGSVRIPETELATVISNPSRIQAAPSPITMRVWKGDQRTDRGAQEYYSGTSFVWWWRPSYQPSSLLLQAKSAHDGCAINAVFANSPSAYAVPYRNIGMGAAWRRYSAASSPAPSHLIAGRLVNVAGTSNRPYVMLGILAVPCAAAASR